MAGIVDCGHSRLRLLKIVLQTRALPITKSHGSEAKDTWVRWSLLYKSKVKINCWWHCVDCTKKRLLHQMSTPPWIHLVKVADQRLMNTSDQRRSVVFVVVSHSSITGSGCRLSRQRQRRRRRRCNSRKEKGCSDKLLSALLLWLDSI